MAVFTVHAPDGDPATPAVAERVVFVREGFSLLAFLMPLVWLLLNRLWLGLLLYLVGLAAVNGLAVLFGATPLAMTLAGLVYSLLFGLEAPALRQWTLRRCGLRQVASIVAKDAEAAELKFFAAAVSGRPAPPAPASTAPPRTPASGGAFLFPEAGRRS
jgi:hypothetical protein